MSHIAPQGKRRGYACSATLTILTGICLTTAAGCGGGAANSTFSFVGSRLQPNAVNARVGVPPQVQQMVEEYNKLQQEAYAPIVENDFQSPLTAPLSTFSADVNTASYSNIRRYLNESKLPPKDAVFLAEMVNYFPYRYPEPNGMDPVSINLDLAPCPWNTQHRLARIGLRAKSIHPSEMPVRNLVFLVDVSGSMGDASRLPLVKTCLNLLVDTLTEQDRVSIVTYASGTAIRLSPTTGDRKDVIKRKIKSLEAGGSTNGSGGLKLAYELARRTFVEPGVNRVILCTDGDFNVGQSSESELKLQIETERKSGVFLTVLGYGMGNLKNQMLETLANHGNGYYAYIDTEAEAYKVFVEQGGALVTLAKDVKLQAEFNPKRVAAYRLLGYENRMLKAEDFKNDAKDAGDMGSGHTVTAFYEIVPQGVPITLPGVDALKYQTPTAPAANAADEWFTVRMRYKHPMEETSQELVRALPSNADGKPMSEDFRFAAAVAEFALVLRDSPYRGGATFASVQERAATSRTFDPNGHRKEFLELVEKAKRASQSSQATARK